MGKDSGSGDDEKKKEDVKWFTIKNATDLQRVRLEKLMKNPVCGYFLTNFGASPTLTHSHSRQRRS